VCFVASNAKSKEKKTVLDTSNNKSKITQRKILLPVRRPEDISKNDFGYFRMSSAKFDQLLVLLGPSFTFQDTHMRKSVPPEERLTVTLR
jgi:hypothetical protein